MLRRQLIVLLKNDNVQWLMLFSDQLVLLVCFIIVL